MPQGVLSFLVAYIVLDGTGLTVGSGEVGEVKGYYLVLRDKYYFYFKSKVRQLVTIKGRRYAEINYLVPNDIFTKWPKRGFEPGPSQFHRSRSVTLCSILLWDPCKNKTL